MRTPVVVASLVIASVATAGQEARQDRALRDDIDQRTLSADEVQRYAAPYYPEIRACYLMHGKPSKTATGELVLQVVVHRNGDIHEYTVDAPGVTGKRLRALSDCIGAQIETWHFPVRRDFTTAILPYYFLHIDLPGTGPQLSCWNPRGCPKR